MKDTVAILGVGLVLGDANPAAVEGVVRSKGGWGYVCDADGLRDVPLTGELRRAGRSQRMAMAAAARAARGADGAHRTKTDTAVYVGTGLGSLSETVDFLENMIRLDEAQPKPAKFINSVHNAAAGAIAIALGLHGENRTFVHESVCFEQALSQALMSLERGRAPSAIVCGVEELNSYVVSVGAEKGWWKTADAALEPLGGPRTKGTLPGEGAAAVFAGATGGNREAAKVLGVSAKPLARSGYPRISGQEEARVVSAALTSWGTSLDEIDLLVIGANGDAQADDAYERVIESLAKGEPRRAAVRTFKGACGEFCAASAVGVAVAAQAVMKGEAKRALVYGLPQGKYRSMILISS